MRVNFLRLTSEERKVYIEEGASRRGVSPVILEKDFWVSWLLGVMFDSTFRDVLVFKGGTSLTGLPRSSRTRGTRQPHEGC